MVFKIKGQNCYTEAVYFICMHTNLIPLSDPQMPNTCMLLSLGNPKIGGIFKPKMGHGGKLPLTLLL